MLSEEKKLLKIFKAQVEKEETEYFSVNAYTQLLYDSHKTVLNLITKQSNILNKIEEYAKGINDKELLLILKSNEIDELINRCKEGGFLNE